MPQILVAGAPTGCWTNAGDEAIFAGMLVALTANIPGASVTVVSSSPVGFFDTYGCSEVRYDDLVQLARAVGRSDLVVIGGGSIFYDYWGADPGAVLTSAHQGVSLWASIALLAASADVPVMVYGVGVGPLRSYEGQLMARVVFEQATVITVRDSESARTIQSLTSAAVESLVTGDPALGFSLQYQPTAEPSPMSVGVAVRPWTFDDASGWPVTLGQALNAYLLETNGTALFVPFHRAVAWPLSDDTDAARAVRTAMDRRVRTQTVSVELPWRERAFLLTRVHVAVAMRYHAALFALMAGVPTIGLAYDPKVVGLFAETGLSSLCILMRDLTSDALLARLADATADRRSLQTQALEATAALRMREQQNGQLAAEVITRGNGSRPTGTAARQLRDLLSATGAVSDETLSQVAVEARTRPRSQHRERSARPRVAILTNQLLDRRTGDPRAGGAERYALDIARLLNDLGCEPTFYQREGPPEGDYYGFPVLGLPRGDPFQEFEIGVADAFFERTADFDHVICLMPNYASGELREDAIVVCHGIWWDHDLWPHVEFRTAEWYEHIERVFTRPRRVVSVDWNSINVVRALYPEAASRMTFIPNAVDTRLFVPPAARPERIPEVIIPRRADAPRGAQLVGPILEHVPDPCRVRWIGGGDPGLIDQLRAVAEIDERLEISSAALDDMPGVLRSADVVVIPTLASEGQSLACLEAMASGCAVVVTRVGGLPELITDGVDGLVCDPTPASIGAALRLLVRDPALRIRLGAAARVSALRHSKVRWRDNWAQLLGAEGWIDAQTARARANAYDIVCFSIIDWRYRWQRPQQLMSAWARRGRRVFYLHISEFVLPDVEPVSVEPLAEGILEVRLSLPPNFHAYSGEYPTGALEAGLRSLTALRERLDIRDAISAVQLASWEPLATAAREAFGWPIVYDCMDDWSTWPGFADAPLFLEREKQLVDSADVVAVSGRTIQRRWENERPDTLLARNAVDFAFYQREVKTDPLPDVAGPIAGFFGAIVEWFDTELLAHVARARPEVTFVLIGGVQRTTVDELEALPNVRLLGHQPYDLLPAFLRRFDACLIPFRVTPVSNGIDPVKFYEYVSLGKPVVSTPIAEILPYSDLLYVADGPDSFAAALDSALAERKPSLRRRRIELARLNTWDDRVHLLENRILDVISRGSSVEKA